MKAVAIAFVVGVLLQTSGVEHALGTWRSAEQFEGESRLSFAFRRQGTEITGWAVLLGQHRKGDNRATLALTFHSVVWDKDRLKFETQLPEDEGTIGWELRVTDANRATLVATTENGAPFDEPLTWEMRR
jgi:hypothetical protein